MSVVVSVSIEERPEARAGHLSTWHYYLCWSTWYERQLHTYERGPMSKPACFLMAVELLDTQSKE